MTLANPIIAASGTFGFGEEYNKFFRVRSLGALVTKTITVSPRIGNPPPRVAEAPSGMLNSIGLENKGIDDFIGNKLPGLEKRAVPVIVSIAGEGTDDFIVLTERLRRTGRVAAVELNLSCPNVGRGSAMIAQDEKMTYRIVRAAVKGAKKMTVIAKLSPKVTDIGSIAKAAEKGGADAISLINTMPGAAVDIYTRSSRLGMLSGGLSGPAIKPIALHLIREVFEAVSIPLVGMGGIMTWEDVVEFLLCGARAVQIGTAHFVNPRSAANIIDGLNRYLAREKIRDIKTLVGALAGG